MKKYLHQPFFITSLLSISILFLVLANYVFGWTTPSQNPPGGNLSAPINTGSSNQAKTGYLSVGTSTMPSFPLDVAGVLRIGGYSSAPSGSNGALYYNTTTNKFQGYQNGSWSDLGGGGSLWTLTGSDIYYNSGNVGIGTTSFGTGERLAVSDGTTKFGIFPGYLDNVANADWVTLDIPSFKGLRVWDSFSVYGNVGIGTTTPSEKLEVSGNIKLSGASPTYKITNVAAPTASSDVATKGYVDASCPTLYITTTRSNANANACVYPNAFCPTGWTIVESWTYSTYTYGPIRRCHRDTLCSK